MIDLDDAAALAARDDGRLLAIARAGATVRRTAVAAERLAPLRGDEIGALGVLASDLLPAAYAEALGHAAIEWGAPAAFTRTVLGARDAFPRAADVVLIVSVNGLESRLLDGLHLAASRGASTVVVAPEGSPIAVAAAERRLALAATDDDEPVSAWWAALAALRLALAGDDVDRLADALDDAAARLGPVVETYRNPAKQVALLDAPLLVVAIDDAAAFAAPLLVEEFGSRVPWSVRGVDVRRGMAELMRYADARRSSGIDDLFYDPDFDGPQSQTPARQLLLLTGVTDPAVLEPAQQVAERIGAVRAVAFGTEERWGAMALSVLAQLSGTYTTLAHD